MVGHFFEALFTKKKTITKKCFVMGNVLLPMTQQQKEFYNIQKKNILSLNL